MYEDYADKHALLCKVNVFDYGVLHLCSDTSAHRGVCNADLGRYTMVTMDSGVYLTSKVISEVLVNLNCRWEEMKCQR